MGVPRVLRLIRGMLRVQHADRDAVRRLQDRRLRALLRYARERSPFYRCLYRGIDLGTCALGDLPVVTKQQMMDHFDDVVTDRRVTRTAVDAWLADKDNLGRMYRRRFIPFRTSGTTGENAIMVYDRAALDTAHAAAIARRALPRPLTGREQLGILGRLLIRRVRFAFILMTGGAYPSVTLARYAPPLHRLFVNDRILSILDPLDRIVAQLNDFQPDSVCAYPSVLAELAREQLAGRLDIRFGTAISRVISLSEPLSGATRALVKRAWGMDVQDAYGTSECLVMATSCSRFDGMHVMSDLCILEVVDRDRRPVPDGHTGEKVLVTNLFNRAQPLIRYEITDVTGYATEPCDCGMPFPRLLPIEGRTGDIFYVDRPGGGYEAIHPYFFLAPICQIDGVREYQLVQTARNAITFNYVPVRNDASLDAAVRRVLEAGLTDASLAGRVTLTVGRVDAIPRDERSGKFRQIVSAVGPPPDLVGADARAVRR